MVSCHDASRELGAAEHLRSGDFHDTDAPDFPDSLSEGIAKCLLRSSTALSLGTALTAEGGPYQDACSTFRACNPSDGRRLASEGCDYHRWSATSQECQGRADHKSAARFTALDVALFDRFTSDVPALSGHLIGVDIFLTNTYCVI
jgi:hypothetical protein